MAGAAFKCDLICPGVMITLCKILISPAEIVRWLIKLTSLLLFSAKIFVSLSPLLLVVVLNFPSLFPDTTFKSKVKNYSKLDNRQTLGKNIKLDMC